MFDLASLKADKDLTRLCLPLLSKDYGGLSGFVDVSSVDGLLEKLTTARYERLKYLPISKLTIFRTCDIGLGYMDYMSLRHFQELIALGKVDKNIPVHLEYKHGNIFCIVYLEDLDPFVMLTDETYLLVNEVTNVIHYIKIGKPCNPNILYDAKLLHGAVSTIEKVATIPHLNSLYIEPKKKNDFLF